MTANLEAAFSSNSDDWPTPWWIIDAVEEKFGSLSLDVCASSSNTKAPRHFDKSRNGLAQEWVTLSWCNPPYSEVQRWMRAAHRRSKSVETICLVPARTDTNWWWSYCRRADVYFLRGRIRFEGANNSAPFPAAIVHFAPESGGSTFYWDIRQREQLIFPEGGR